VIAAAVAGDRRSLDELAADLGARDGLLRLHATRHRLQHEEDGLQIDVHDAVPLGLGDVEHRLHADHARVVEQHVEAPPATVWLLDHAGDVGRPGDVGLNGDGAKLGGELLRRRAVDVGEHETVATGGQPAGRGGADAARGAGNEDSATLALSHGLLPVHAL